MPDRKPNNNLTPKDDFLAAKLGEQFMEVVQNPTFRRAAEAAYAQYVLALPFDPGNAYRIDGARGMINTLLNFGEAHSDLPKAKPVQLETT